jgi:hypothetical protein
MAFLGDWHIWFAWCFLAAFPFPVAENRWWRGVRYGLAALCGAGWAFLVPWFWQFLATPLKSGDPGLMLFLHLPSWWFSARYAVIGLSRFCLGVGIVAVVIRNYLMIRDPGARKRIEIVAGVTGLIVPLNVIFLHYGNMAGNLLPIVIPPVFAYAVLQHRVLDLRIVVRRACSICWPSKS